MKYCIVAKKKIMKSSFLDEEKKIIHIAENLTPESRASCKNAKYVLELKAGIITEKSLKIRDYLVIQIHNSL
ncbi:MAG: DUF192 domain-containing protein [Clostridiaceae bacterium]|nr:DUF192 domain-containing protein [Clostridiaceae bacterium]